MILILLYLSSFIVAIALAMRAHAPLRRMALRYASVYAAGTIVLFVVFAFLTRVERWQSDTDLFGEHLDLTGVLSRTASGFLVTRAGVALLEGLALAWCLASKKSILSLFAIASLLPLLFEVLLGWGWFEFWAAQLFLNVTTRPDVPEWVLDFSNVVKVCISYLLPPFLGGMLAAAVALTPHWGSRVWHRACA